MAFLSSFPKPAASAIADSTIKGDVTIDGDLTVNGAATGTYDSILKGRLQVLAAEGASAIFDMFADEGDDDADQWRLSAEAAGSFTIQNKSTGSFVDSITINGSGQVGIGGAPSSPLTISHSGGDGVEAIQIVNTNGSPGSFSWATTAIQDDMANSQRYLHIIGKAESNYNSGWLAYQHKTANSAQDSMMSIGLYGVNDILNVTGHSRVGIGTTAPSDTLHIYKGSDGNSGMQIQSTGSGTPSVTYLDLVHADGTYRIQNQADKFGIYDVSGSAMRLLMDNTGKIAIGHSSPQEMLDLSGGNIRLDNDQHIGWATTDGNQGRVQIRGNESDDTILFRTDNATRMKIDASSRISLSNNDSGGTGGEDSTTGNTVFGYLSGNNIDSGSVNNIFIGHQVGSSSNISDATSNVLIGGNSGRDLTTGDSNVSIGWNSARSLNSGEKNTFLGDQAGHGVTQRSNNVYIGYEAGKIVDGAGNNVGIGYQSMLSSGTAGNNTATDNTALGYQSLKAITTGDYNVAIGSQAGDAITTASYNTVIGKGALSTATTAAGNVFIGYDCGLSIPASQALSAVVAIGKDAFVGSGSTTTGANGTVAIGDSSLKVLTTGGSNTAVGYQSLMTLATGNNNTAVGYQALRLSDGADSNQTAIGSEALENSTTGTNTAVGAAAMKWVDDGSANVAVGYLAMTSAGADAGNTASDNVAIGKSALAAITDGNNNVAIGSSAGLAITTNSSQVAIGASALAFLTSGTENTAVGYNAGYYNATGGYNVYLGYQSGFGASSGNNSYNTAIGNRSLASITDGQGNTVLGTWAGRDLTTGDANVAIGAYDGAVNSALRLSTDVDKAIAIGSGAMGGAIVTDGADGTVAVGYTALTSLTSGAGNVAIGYQSGRLMTTGGSNTVIGYQAMASNLTGTYNVAIGKESLLAAAHGEANNIAIGAGSFGNAKENVAAGASHAHTLDHNIGIGRNALLGGDLGTADSVLTHQGNIAIGSYALDATGTNPLIGNIAIGHNSLTALTSGSGNTALGYQAGLNHTTGGGCVYIGYNTGDHCTDGHRNVAIGEAALSGNADDDNVAVGYGALGACTGTDNVAMGTSAGDVISTGSSNTIIGKGSDPSANDATNQTVIGFEVTGVADNSVVLGNANVTTCYIGSGATSNYGTNTHGAATYAKKLYLKESGLAYNSGGVTSLLTIHGSFNDSPSNPQGIGMDFVLSAEDTDNGAVMSKIDIVSNSGVIGSSGAAFGTEMQFWNKANGGIAKQLVLKGGDDHIGVWVYGNAASRYALNVANDGNNANRYGIDIDAGADDASGTTHYLNCNDGNGDQVGHISNTDGTFALTDVSDKRLKTNIVDTSVKGVETVDKMKVRDFEWIKSGDKTTAGFVAQELAEAFPSAVTGEDGAMEDILDEDGNKTGEKIKPMGVSRDVLVPVLIKAVQELSARVKELEGK